CESYEHPAVPPQTIISLPVHAAVCAHRAAGALVALVATQLFVPGLYLPPVLRPVESSAPPQTIISLPVQVAVKSRRPVGALVVLVAVQVSVFGLYLPPVSKEGGIPSQPPQTTVPVPVHTAA